MFGPNVLFLESWESWLCGFDDVFYLGNSNKYIG